MRPGPESSTEQPKLTKPPNCQELPLGWGKPTFLIFCKIEKTPSQIPTRSEVRRPPEPVKNEARNATLLKNTVPTPLVSSKPREIHCQTTGKQPAGCAARLPEADFIDILIVSLIEAKGPELRPQLQLHYLSCSQCVQSAKSRLGSEPEPAVIVADMALCSPALLERGLKMLACLQGPSAKMFVMR